MVISTRLSWWPLIRWWTCLWMEESQRLWTAKAAASHWLERRLFTWEVGAVGGLMPQLRRKYLCWNQRRSTYRAALVCLARYAWGGYTDFSRPLLSEPQHVQFPRLHQEPLHKPWAAGLYPQPNEARGCSGLPTLSQTLLPAWHMPTQQCTGSNTQFCDSIPHKSAKPDVTAFDVPKPKSS